jgi:pimeloyl-ACP methyl ester carboxylesterase
LGDNSLNMPQYRRRWLQVILLALLSSLIACNFPSLAAPTASSIPAPGTPSPTISDSFPPATSTPFQAPSPQPTGTPAPAAPTESFQPAFEPAACAFPVPDGYRPQCGYLVVPENRARPGSPLIRLHVAVFRSRSAHPEPDPVLHLAGGPGSSSLGEADYIFRQGLDAILESRDFVLFDQRGTGYSQPRLDCPEREALTPDLLEGSLTGEAEDQAVVDAFQRCHDRLVDAGIDLSAYTSAASAADVNDLRQALGYGQLNLYAVSYGTRLALTILRDFPAAVRSAVLDSTYPPQVNLYTSLAPNAQRAFNLLFQNCSSDPPCSAAYPHLEAVFYALVDELNAKPVAIGLTAGGTEHRVQLDGDLLVDVLFVGLYNPLVTAAMPKMIFDVRRGDYTILRERLRLYFDTSTALGMQMSVQCGEEIPFSTPEDAIAAAQGVRPELANFFPASVQPLFTACQNWVSTPLDPRENQAAGSDLPALVLAGEYDPITPPDWGRMAANTLPHAYFYEFPGNGHWVTRSSSCARSMALAFWENPDVAPDSTCASSLGDLNFIP